MIKTDLNVGQYLNSVPAMDLLHLLRLQRSNIKVISNMLDFIVAFLLLEQQSSLDRPYCLRKNIKRSYSQYFSHHIRLYPLCGHSLVQIRSHLTLRASQQAFFPLWSRHLSCRAITRYKPPLFTENLI